MLKKILIGGFVFVFLVVLGLFFWARAVFTHDNVRAALAAQVAKAIGQPVTIGSIGAGVYPRVTVNLGDVTIGEPPRIKVRALHVGTDFRALVSRRIEHANLRLTGARVELPLPPLTVASSDSPEQSSGAPLEIVSIDEIVLNEVEVVSGGRTLRGDIEVEPHGKALTLRKMTLGAEDAKIDATGQITDISAPAGEISVKAGALNLDQLLAFASDFSGGAGLGPAKTSSAPRADATDRPRGTAGASAMNIAVSLDADRAKLGAMSIDRLSGKARLTPEGVTLQPLTFGLFSGRYQGTLAVTLAGRSPAYRWKAALTGVDVAAATAFAGSPGTVSGRLSGTIDLVGQGADAASAIRTARGRARVDITDGVVKNLGLVRRVVTVTSGRSGASSEAGGGSSDEPFTRLGASLAIANGAATTDDLRFESKDLSLAAAGSVRLDGSAINLAGKVQLSESLTKQAGSDLVRYTQEQGRVTLPATITGSAAAPSVRIDAGSLAKRAITNRANEEAQKVLKKGLGGLFKRP